MLTDYKLFDEINRKIRLLEVKLKLKAKWTGQQVAYLRSSNTKLQDLYHKQDKLNKKIVHKYSKRINIEQLDKLCAYVVFESPVGKTKTLQRFAKANRIKLWEYDKEKRKYRFCVPPKKNFKLLGKHKLNLVTAPDPTEIIWENLEVSHKETIIRKLIVILVVGCVLLIGCAIIYIIRIYKSTILDTNGCEDFNKTVDELVTNEDINCYCSSKTFFMFITDNESRNTWNKYFLLIAYQQLIIVLISGLIFSVNELIEITFVKLAKFSRHKYLTQMSKELTLKIFVLMYLNTGILMVLADMDIAIWPLTYFVSSNKRPKDTAKKWFIESGNSIFTLMLLNIIGFWLINFSRALFKKWKACWFKKYTILHQNTIKLFEGVKFNMPLNYARTLTVIFVCFTYWNAFPVLMYILWIYLNWQYWMEKFMILRHYKIPSRVDTNMHNMVMDILPYWLLIHWIYSWWFYGSPGILDNWWYDANRSATSLKSFKVRITSRYGLPFFVFAAIIFLVLLFKNTLLKWHNDIKTYLHGAAVEPLGIARNFHHDKANMEETGIITYDIKANPEYSYIISAIAGTKEWATRQSVRFIKNRIHSFNLKHYKSDDETHNSNNLKHFISKDQIKIQEFEEFKIGSRYL